jgi:hypothetical protein
MPNKSLDGTSAEDVWEKLRKLYASADASNVVVIENEIHHLKYSSGSMEEHFNQFRYVIERHKSAEER